MDAIAPPREIVWNNKISLFRRHTKFGTHFRDMVLMKKVTDAHTPSPIVLPWEQVKNLSLPMGRPNKNTDILKPNLVHRCIMGIGTKNYIMTTPPCQTRSPPSWIKKKISTYRN
ncbi:hypothetical protein NL108_011634 [Boleophthalmus pectinirostris]|nr:hypothetical protein NL108_011634 [Boleophthalmus pectinirostris]